MRIRGFRGGEEHTDPDLDADPDLYADPDLDADPDPQHWLDPI